MERKQLALLREVMNKYGTDWYMVPTDDDHLSEYVGDYFKCREWLSGFTGSAGTLVVGLQEAALFTDGRYFVQAEKELKDSGICLMKSGVEGVPTVKEYIAQKMQNGETLSYDAKVVSAAAAEDLAAALKEEGKDVKIAPRALLEEIWEDRPKRSCEKVRLLDVKYAGVDVDQKLSDLRAAMKAKKAEGHVITGLDDIAWLYNIRGNDVECSPLVLSYAYVTETEAYVFIQPEAVTEECRKALAEKNVQILDYDGIYEFLEGRTEKSVLLDTDRVNSKIAASFKEGTELIKGENPTTLMKAVKNETEIRNVRNCHVKDGVAITRFIRWIKLQYADGVKKSDLTELEASKYLDNMRREIDTNTDLSFPTIAAFGPNGAMMHYSAKEGDTAVLEPGSFFLVDSGGQYYEGTTDITRTMILGEVNAEQKKHFTAVVRGMLNLMGAKFLEGCSGMNLDILARQPMWELGIDYRCGTGHGVGYYLNVHEGPNGIRTKSAPGHEPCPLQPGMITTDEPGIYLEGKYGIRIENELLCVKAEKNEYGQFLCFEPVTYAPIDLDGIDASLMNEKEKRILNEYHRMVNEKLSPYLTEEEKEWLDHYTRPVL